MTRRKKSETVTVAFEVTQPMAAYLAFLAKERGWGDDADGAAKAIVMSEVMQLQVAGFHHKSVPR